MLTMIIVMIWPGGKEYTFMSFESYLKTKKSRDFKKD